MAIGISGTNSNSSSVQVSVGPAGFVHRRDKEGIFSTDITNTSPFLIGCFDPGNKKCYSGGGTSATEFISGINYTITGNANSDTIFKTDNLGIIEITGDGYIKSNGSYPQAKSSVLGESNTIEFWFWPATGATQEEAIIQFRKNNGTNYENGFTLTRTIGATTSLRRGMRITTYANNGLPTSGSGIQSNALWLNTWNRVILASFRNTNIDTFRIYYLNVVSPYHTFNRFDATISAIGIPRGTGAGEWDQESNLELTIGKADGVTGTFRGKIGYVKIYKGQIFNTPDDPPEEANGLADSFDWTYYPFAPRYDQYD